MYDNAVHLAQRNSRPGVFIDRQDVLNDPITLDALVQLLNWLIKTYELGRDDILRHYDVIGIIRS